MPKKRLISVYFIVATIILPISFLLNTNTKDVRGNWMEDSYVLTVEGFDCTEASIGINSSGIIHYIFTQKVYAGDGSVYSSEICIGDTENAEETFEDYVYLSEGNSTLDPKNTTSNCNPQLVIDKNIVHVVWQGKHPGASKKYQIFYSNNTNGNFSKNIVNITDDEAQNHVFPSIAAINGTIFITYYDGTELVMKTNLNGNYYNSSGKEFPISRNKDGFRNQLSMWKKSDLKDWRLDFLYVNKTGDLNYLNLTKGESIKNFNQSINRLDLASSGPYKLNFSIDSNQHMASIAYIKNYEVYAANSTSDLSPIQITDNSKPRFNPRVLLNGNNITTILYVQNISTNEGAIVATDNYAYYFQNHSVILNQANVPGSNIQKVGFKSFDADMVPGEGIIILYEVKKKTGPSSTWSSNHLLHLSGYVNLYNDDNDFYNTFSWYDDLGGAVYSEGWIIEGMNINFNSSSGEDFNFTITLRDYITGKSWSYETKFNGSGGEDYKITFFRPDNTYFIAKNKFEIDLNLDQPSGNTTFIRLEVDPLDIQNGLTNYSSNYDGDEQSFFYTIQDLSTGFEFTVLFYDKTNNIKDRVYTKSHPASIGTLSSSNHVDLYKFSMIGGEQYNMTLSVDNNYKNNVTLLIYNETHQITSEANAISVYKMRDWNGKSFTLSTASDVDIYIVIVSDVETNVISYTFSHQVNPLAAKLIAPINDKFIGENSATKKVNYIFQWDFNDDETLFTSADIKGYDFRIYNSNGTVKYAVLNYAQKTLNLTLTETYLLDLPDGTYIWEIRIVTLYNQRSNGLLARNTFYIDTHAPGAPTLKQPTTFYDVDNFIVTWTAGSDEKFSVNHYELYGSTEENFECTPATLIDANVKKLSYGEYSKANGQYFYKAISVDNVNLKSNPSNLVTYTVSLYGWIDPSGQTFRVLAGDYLEYKIVDVIEEGNHDPNDLYAIINNERYQMNSLMHFWISQVDKTDFVPIKGHLYKKGTNITAQQLQSEFVLVRKNADVFPFVTSPNVTYQSLIFNLSLLRYFGTDKEFDYSHRSTWYMDTFSTVEVVIHTYSLKTAYDTNSSLSDQDIEYDQAIFVVDKASGLVIEETIYDSKTHGGYSIKLVGTSVYLAKIDWWIGPLMTIGILGIIAAIINQIVKKLERRL